MVLELPQRPLERAERLDQQQGDQAKYRPGDETDQDNPHLPGPPEGVLQGRKRRAHPTGEVSHDACDEGGKDHGVVEATEVQHFDSEQRARYRRSEDRSEARTDPADDETPAVRIAQAQNIREQARERGTDLRGGPLLADRATKGKRQHRGAEFYRRDQPVDASGPLMDSRDDGFGPVPSSLGSECPDEPYTGGKRYRQHPESREHAAGERLDTHRGAAEGPQEGSRAEADTQTRPRTE